MFVYASEKGYRLRIVEMENTDFIPYVVNAAMDEKSLKLLPLDTEDQGTQRCRLGPGTMASLGLKIGSLVQISLLGGHCLCTAWPRSDLAEGFMQFDSKCVTVELIGKTYNMCSVNLNQIKMVPSTKLKCIHVKVFVKNVEFKKGATSALLHELVKEVLRNVYVSQSHVVSFASLEAPIELIEIQSLNPSTCEAGRITAKTIIEITEVKRLESYMNQLKNSSKIPLGGMEDVCASLKEILNLPFHYPRTLQRLGLSCPKGVLLVGPPGVGKTLLVRSVAREVCAHLVTISGPVILGSRPGESEENLRRIFQRTKEASEDGPCVLFIDELDSLCPKRTGSTNATENRLVAQLLTLMDGIGSEGHMVIMAATNRPDALDPALRRSGRFDREVIIGAPTLKQRKSILEMLSTQMPLCSDVDVASLAEMTTGYVGADLTALCREAALQAILHSSQDAGSHLIRMSNFLEALKKVHPSCLRSSIGQTDFRPVAWEHIGGLEDVKLKLKQSIEWPMKFPEAFIRLGLSRPKGVLLYGPPGCAKTTLVKAAATSCHCSFLSVSGADLFSPYVGDSEKTLAQVFQQARACAPSVLFLDEIDSILGSRADSKASRGVQDRVLSVILNELDGIGLKVTERRGPASKKCLQEGLPEQQECDRQLDYQEVCNKDVLVVAATNRPDLLDDALLRPGRLDKIVYVPPPDQEARLAILKICTEKMPLDSDVSLEDVAEKTSFFSGADLENLCKEAALLTLQEESLDASCIKHASFVMSLENTKPSLTAQQIEFYQKLLKSRTLVKKLKKSL
ncbi:spermatogenesis-associated protein 5-like protein 1 [Huso huso]|uniref:Spermatogenesis-associated protein 5-like protein 1 n=1 Tax=Huso huso TaxID=61971 RepID=A0ABR0YRN2_HUSHU